MNEIEDGIYLHKLFDIAYLVKGDKVMIRDPEKTMLGIKRNGSVAYAIIA